MINSLTGLYERLGDVDSAYKYLLKCFETCSKSRDRIKFGEDLAKLLYNAGFYSETMICCRHVLDLDKDNMYCRCLTMEIIKDNLKCANNFPIASLDPTITPLMIMNYYKNKDKLPSLNMRRILTPSVNLKRQRDTFPIFLHDDSTLFDFSVELLKTFSILYGIDLFDAKIFNKEDHDYSESILSGISMIQIQINKKDKDVIMEIDSNVSMASEPANKLAEVEGISGSIAVDDELNSNNKRSVKDELTRTSARFRKIGEVEKPVPVVSSKFQISDLNHFLPSVFHFKDEYPLYTLNSTGIEYWTNFANHLESKSATIINNKKKKFKKITSAELHSKAETAFYKSSEALFKFFQTIEIETFHPISRISTLFLIFLISYLESEDVWTASQLKLIVTILQVLSQFSMSIVHAFETNSNYFSSSELQFKFILFIAEVLFDRLPHQEENGTLPADDDVELDGSNNLNPLLRCSTQALFDRSFSALFRLVTISKCNIPKELLIRYSIFNF